jgi:hypothetical protein
MRRSTARARPWLASLHAPNELALRSRALSIRPKMVDRRDDPPILKQESSDVVTDVISERVEESDPAELNASSPTPR